VLISAPRLIPADETGSVLAPGYAEVTGGRITEVGQGPPPRPADVVLRRGILAPGLVDLQVNGYFGISLQAGQGPGWATVARRLPETGVTSFLPTFITAPLPQLIASLRAAAELIPQLPPGGARVLGVHTEGPFIAPRRRGAHSEPAIIPPTPGAVTDLITAAAGQLTMVTLAPEREGGLAAVARLAGAGVLVSVGHSDATAAQVSAAADAGARMVTHLYNAQRPLHHREPGVVGQALTDPRLTSGLIADLRHVSVQACLIAFAAAPGRIALVTDAAACAGMPPGRYQLGSEPVELRDGVPVLADGTLAGSALRLDTAVAHMVAAGVALPTALTAATRVPADLIGRPDLGRIGPGAAADLIWLDDDLRTQAAWVAGEKVYGTSEGEADGEALR
jgi:N-acetylglucosamine-6-phosphate deacetylase